MSRAEIEAVLSDFRAWLTQSAAAESEAEDPAAQEPAPDLHTLLAEWIALRHEVNLQTRAVRSQQEQNAETLRQLSQAVQALDAGQRAAGRDHEDVGVVQRALLKTLLDVYDALRLAENELRRLQDNVWSALDQLVKDAGVRDAAAQAPPAATGFLSRLLGRAPTPRQAGTPRHAEEAAAGVRRMLESIFTGYGMGVQRIERALQQHGLEPIPCAGLPFDPERMEVVDVVRIADRQPGEVVEEVRRGFLRDGRVFRYAQVRVAQPPGQ